MPRTVVLVGLFAASVAGCSKPAMVAAPVPDATIAAPAERVWAALTEVYTDASLPIDNIDRSSWFLRSGRMVSRPNRGAAGMRNEEMFDCGGERGKGMLGWDPRMESRAKDETITFMVTTLLRPGNDGTTSVRNRITATAESGAECVSKGTLEARISAALQERAMAQQ